MSEAAYLPDAGHLIWTADHGARTSRSASGAGRLAGGVHPEHRLRHRLSNHKHHSALSDQRRDPRGLADRWGSIDSRARTIRYAGAEVPPEIAHLVRAKLSALITI